LQRALEGAGQYYEFSDRAWADDPSSEVDPDTNPVRECRQAYTILMTDGYYSTGKSYNPDLSSYADDTDGPVISEGLNAPYQYLASPPFSDGHTGTVSLADIAMHYWKRDLRPDIDNIVPVTKDVIGENTKKPGNPAFWQHMVTYGVGLGVAGTVDPDEAYAAAVDGTPIDWWGGNDNEDKINDLLHAAVNSRGAFFSSSDPEEFQSDLESILTDAAGRAGSSTGLDFNITSFKEGALLFSAAFDPAGWTGDVTAVELKQNAEGEPEIPDDADEAGGWSARDKLDARDLSENDRTIITYNGSMGRPFRWSELTAEQKADLAYGNSSLAQDRLEFIRGDRSFELDPENFRQRGSRLGSIVNSTPRYVAEPDSEWPNSSAFGDGKYSLYRTAQKDRTPVVYAGSNDGMLHGFKGTADESGGEEVLAYIPSFVYSSQAGKGLHFLTEPDYEHRYYVDLETRVTDVYMQGRNSVGSISPAQWRTVLIGGGRAGAKGIFALDITDPDGFSEDSAQSTVLWEFTHEKLGYLVQPPVVALADWGGGDYRWTVFLSSGYNSTSTGFFMLDIEGGLDGNWSTSDYRYVEFESGDGLGPLTVIDNTSDYIADRVYAGDLDGNLWVAAKSGNSWASAYKQGNSAMPYVSVGQPITSAPTVGPSTVSGKDPNLMILFGTGQYLQTSDVSSVDVQSFYGVLEEGDTKNTVTPSDLVLRQLQTGSGQVDGVTQLIRYAEGDAVDYESKKGWYVNLPVQGERIVTNGVIRGNYVYVSTLIPSSDPCLGGGDGWIMAFDLQEGLVGLNDDVGAFEDSTYNAMGYKVDGVPSQLKIWDEYLAYDCAGCGAQLDSLPPFGLALGRKGWRELTQ
jgi:type IV pilus assembly protein PilY1